MKETILHLCKPFVVHAIFAWFVSDLTDNTRRGCCIYVVLLLLFVKQPALDHFVVLAVLGVADKRVLDQTKVPYVACLLLQENSPIHLHSFEHVSFAFALNLNVEVVCQRWQRLVLRLAWGLSEIAEVFARRNSRVARLAIIKQIQISLIICTVLSATAIQRSLSIPSHYRRDRNCCLSFRFSSIWASFQ